MSSMRDIDVETCCFRRVFLACCCGDRLMDSLSGLPRGLNIECLPTGLCISCGPCGERLPMSTSSPWCLLGVAAPLRCAGELLKFEEFC